MRRVGTLTFRRIAAQGDNVPNPSRPPTFCESFDFHLGRAYTSQMRGWINRHGSMNPFHQLLGAAPGGAAGAIGHGEECGPEWCQFLHDIP